MIIKVKRLTINSFGIISIFMIIIIYLSGLLYYSGNRSNISLLPQVLVYFIILASFINSMLHKESNLITIFLIILIIILMGGTYSVDFSNGDYVAYKSTYDLFLNGHTLGAISNRSIGFTDKGYLALMYIFSRTKLSYNFFATFISIVAMTLMINTARTYSRNITPIFFLYVINPFTYDVYQIRFFLGYSIVIFALRYLIDIQKRNRLKYCAFILFASLIHFSIIFFLLFLLPINGEKIKRNWKIIVRITVIFGALNYIFGINIGAYLLRLLPMTTHSSYATSGFNISFLTFAYVSIELIIFVILVIEIIKLRKTSKFNMLLNINELCLILIPLIAISLEFERLLRPVYFWDYILLANSKKCLKKNIYNFLFITTTIVLILRQSVLMGMFQSLIMNNYILKFIFGC